MTAQPPTEPRRHTAYLVVFLDTAESPPVASSACIFSEPSPTTLARLVPLVLWSAAGETYAEAQNLVRDSVTKAPTPHYDWLRAIFCERT